jgi:hypothetical protein
MLLWRDVMGDLAYRIRAAKPIGEPAAPTDWVGVGAIGGYLVATDFALEYPGEAAALRAMIEAAVPTPAAQVAERAAMIERLRQALVAR